MSEFNLDEYKNISTELREIRKLLLKDKKFRMKYQKAVERIFDISVQIVGSRLVDSQRVVNLCTEKALGEMIESTTKRKKK